jgi:hypothetical protein
MNIAKYEVILDEINAEIGRFNAFLMPERRIPTLNPGDLDSMAVVANVPWEIQDWGMRFGGHPGVYALCGFQEDDPSRLGIYVGKASMKKNIGNRLWSHLQQHRSTAIYKTNDSTGRPFIIEIVIGIALRNPEMRAFAPSLEEFIICGVKDRVYLLNHVGNTE